MTPVCRLLPDVRFAVLRAFVDEDVEIEISQFRSNDPRTYFGRVVAVAESHTGSGTDVVVLHPKGGRVDETYAFSAATVRSIRTLS